MRQYHVRNPRPAYRREHAISKFGSNAFEGKEPDQHRCCICGQIRALPAYQDRPTGAGGQVFRYRFCADCWQEFDAMCNRPSYIVQTVLFARWVWPESYDFGEMGFGRRDYR